MEAVPGRVPRDLALASVEMVERQGVLVGSEPTLGLETPRVADRR